MPNELDPFHLAIEVRDLPSAREFYGGLFGCPEGRSSERWVDFDFLGHQLVCHVCESYPAARKSAANPVDGKQVPIPHFGVVVSMEKWKQLAAKLSNASVEFIIEPYIRFEGEVGEQATMFLYDPSGNALEFKAFADRSKLFSQ